MLKYAIQCIQLAIEDDELQEKKRFSVLFRQTFDGF